MVVRNYTFKYEKDGKRITDCELIASTTPNILPTNALGIERFPKSYDLTSIQFAAGSILYITDIGAVYMANESGEFVLQPKN